MPSLFNPTLHAPALPCYWSPDYVFPEPFVNASRCSPDEHDFYDEADQLFYDSFLETLLSETVRELPVFIPEQNGVLQSVKQTLLNPEFQKILSETTSEITQLQNEKISWACNTQLNCGRPHKITLNRQDFLQR